MPSKPHWERLVPPDPPPTHPLTVRSPRTDDDFTGYPTDAYTHLPDNRVSGERPLLTPDDVSTPNPAYWDNVEAIVAAARRHGMAVLLVAECQPRQGTPKPGRATGLR